MVTRENHSSAFQGRSATAATVCWARTSRGFSTKRVSSMAPAPMASAATAQSTSSRRVRGTMTARDRPPTE